MTIEIKDTNQILDVNGGRAGVIPSMFMKILKLQYGDIMEVEYKEDTQELHITKIDETIPNYEQPFKIKKTMKVRKIGGSHMIAIPKAFFDELGLKIHDTIEWELTLEGVIIMRFNV